MLGVSGVWATVTMPTLTTDVNNPVYYTIKNFRCNKYAAYTGASSQLAQVATTTSATLWYFVENGTGVSIVPADDPSVKLASTTSATAEGSVWYLVENPYNAGYFCVSLKSDLSANCWDDQGSHTKIGYWRPASGDYQGTSWTIERATTIPTGYYYFKGMETGRYPYLYSDFVAKEENNTYHHSPLAGKNGEIWKVTNNGSTYTLTNGEGLPLIIGSTSYKTLTIGSSAVGPDIYFTEAINLTTWGNDTKLTTWGGHPDATDNHWTFERADVSDGIYNVVTKGHADGYVTYNGQNAKNGGFFVASTITTGDLSAPSFDGYSATISITDRTITLTYDCTISYTLTDMNGATYVGTYPGIAGVDEPPISGCASYSLSNKIWDGKAFTADISFPFPVSTGGVTNWTYMGNFQSLSRALQWAWHVTSSEDTNIITQSNVLPTNESGEIEKWEWSIIPSFSAGAFTFTIKNAATNKYVTFSASQHNHDPGSVTLTETGTPFEVVVNGAYGGYAWKQASASYYISLNTYQPSPADKIQNVGQHGSFHYGTAIGYPEATDFATLMTNLKTAYNNYNNYLLFVNTNPDKYTETVPGTMMEVYSSYSSTTNNVTKEPATAFLTGPQFSTYINAFNNAVAGLIPNVPAGSFIRIKTSPTLIPTPTYLTSANVKIGGYDNCSFTQDVNQINGAESIFYYDGSSLLTFSTGRWILNDAGFVIWDSNASPAASGTPIKFEKNAYGEIGMANIKFNNARYIYTNNSTPIYTWADTTPNAEKFNFVIEDVESLPVTITAVNYATLYSPVALTIPSGVTAYTATISGDKLVLTPVSTTIPKNTGVLLYSATPDTYNFDITDDVDAIDGNAFSGTVATINRSKTEEVYNSYILSGGSSGIGFYRDGPTTLAGFKAFVDATPSGDVKQFLQFDFGNADAIQTISNVLQSENREIYNLAGQRLNSLQRGVNIVNGKKVLVK